MKSGMPVANPWLVRIWEWFARVRARVEALVSGRAPDDPLYLTNRTWKQKLILAAIAAVPVIILILLVMAATTDVFRLHNKVDPYERPVAEGQAPVATPAKHSPDPTLNPADLEVVNIHIVRDAHAPTVTGVVRNNTGQKVESAEVSYYLADEDGSLLGTESIDVENVAPHGSVTFHLPLKQTKAEYVIVRDVHVN
jgi:hypothetical protein